jgi:phosphomethylpyrimidine synthase
MITTTQSVSSPSYSLPLQGAANPGATPDVTTPGSFALKADIGGPLMFASPDTPGMPAPSNKTAWDFLPPGWSAKIIDRTQAGAERCCTT